RRTSAKPVQGIISYNAVFIRRLPPIPMVSAIWHTDSRLVPLVSGVASLLGTWGYDAAYIPADAHLHALSNQHRNALHEMRRADEAGPDRAARHKLRRADLPVHALRLRRKL